MKRLLIAAIILGTSIVAVPSTEARSVTNSVTASDPQVRIQIGRNRRYNRRYYRRGARSVVTTRIVRIGAYRYRETIRVMYLPNGMTRTTVISRVRLGRWYRY
jgi:hypothetical protein